MLRRTLNFCVGSLAIFYGVIAHGQTKPNAQTIVSAMVAQYKNASSYQDSGTVSLVQAEPKFAKRFENISFQSPALNNDTLVSFKTYYARPKMFRFDWKSAMMKGPREASIWSDGKKIYEWMPSVGARDDGFTLSTSKYLTLTVDQAARSSAGTAFFLISMFISEASVVSFDQLLTRATELALIREEPVEHDLCYVIKANLSGAPWTFWIDKQSHLLRKTRTVYSYGSFHERVEKGIRREFVAEEIHRQIRINEPVPADVFKYRPKLEAHDFDLTR